MGNGGSQMPENFCIFSQHSLESVYKANRDKLCSDIIMSCNAIRA